MSSAGNSLVTVKPGGYIAFPEAYGEAAANLREVLRVMHRPAVINGAAGNEFFTDAIVVDASGVTADLVDAETIANDCDLLKRIALESTDELRDIVREMQSGTASGVQRALEIGERIGLTERAAAQAGGGFIIIIVIIALGLGASGCGAAAANKTAHATTLPTGSGK